LIKAGPAVRWAGSPLGRQSGWNLLPDLVLLNIPNPKLHVAGRTLQAAPWQQLDFLFKCIYFKGAPELRLLTFASRQKLMQLARCRLQNPGWKALEN